MTHDELLAKIDEVIAIHRRLREQPIYHNALRAVVELHKPEMLHRGYEQCIECGYPSEYPCETIQQIQEQLQ